MRRGRVPTDGAAVVPDVLAPRDDNEGNRAVMPWFLVDDGLHSHPKAMVTTPAAIGLWTLAGSWASANLTEGFVPAYMLDRLVPGGASLAAELVDNGLWKRVKSGYRFHDWQDYQPTKEEVEKSRKLNRERQRRFRAKRQDEEAAKMGSAQVT